MTAFNLGQDLPISPPAIPEPDESIQDARPPKTVNTPFRTSLKLTPEREAEMIEYATKRLEEVKLEVGLGQMGVVTPGTWMEIRWRNEQSYQNDRMWRLAIGDIFRKHNFSLGSGIRHTRYISARVQDDLLGTTPFFAAMPRRIAKEELARQVEKYVQADMDRSNVRNDIRQAQKNALIRNECVVKLGWRDDSTPFVGPATVLVTKEGEPVRTETKELYVMENDNFSPHPVVEGLMMLEKDPSFTVVASQTPGVLIVKGGPYDGAEVSYAAIEDLPQQLPAEHGLKAEGLDYRSFLCPLRYRSIHDADINVHLYKESPSRLRRRYGNIDIGERYFSWFDMPGDKQPKYEQGEQDQFPSSILQEATIAEVFMRWDADEDQQDEEVFLVLDVRNKRAIYYNYMANHFKKRPFEVIPGIERIPDRWYGRGIFSLTEDHILVEDAKYNRQLWKNGTNAGITFGIREACEEWQNGIEPVMGTDHIHWVNPTFNATDKPPIWRTNLFTDTQEDDRIMETTRQAQDAMLGSISVRDAGNSDFNQSKTATGDTLLQQSSDVITKATEQDQAEGINAILEQLVDISLENMDPAALVADEETNELQLLNRDEARALDRDVRLTLTRSRSTQRFATNQQALAIVKDYRMTMLQDPEGAQLQRPLCIEMLQSLEVSDADKLLPEITPEMIQQFQQSQQQAQQEPAKPLSKSISTKYGDLARSEQEQVLASEGIQPAEPEEIAAQEARKQAEKQATKPNGNQPNGTHPTERA